MSDHDQPVNIGNPTEITILQLAKEIVSLTNTNSKIAFIPLPEDDPKVRQPDIRKAREILDWEPNVESVVGLEKTIHFFKSKLKSASNF